MPESNQTALMINARGNVVLQRVSVNSSDAGHGIQMIADGKITLTNIFTASNFLNGLNVDATKSIGLTSVEARQNSVHGAFLVNNHPGSTGGVTISTSIFFVTMTLAQCRVHSSTEQHNLFNHEYKQQLDFTLTSLLPNP